MFSRYQMQIHKVTVLMCALLCAVSGVSAQHLAEGDWIGRIIHLTGRHMDTVNTVYYEGDSLQISMAVDNYGPFDFKDIRTTKDSLSFVWEPSFELTCRLYRFPDDVFQGACMDPWGGFGGIVMAPPGTDLETVELDDETIESIAGWTPPPDEEPILAPNYPEGEMVTVEGSRINYVATGTGPVTVVLVAGLGDDLTSWELLHKRLSGSMGVIAYDRAGLGLSEASTLPRTSEQMATELRGLLRKADIMPPYLLVAHAEGAFMARRFETLYKDDVEAIVLIDPHHEDQASLWKELSSRSWEHYWDRKKIFFKILPGVVAREFVNYADIIDRGEFPGLAPAPVVPTLVLTAGQPKAESSWIGESAAGRSAWKKFHALWVESMPQGRHVVFNASGPYIHHEDPDGVARLIEALAADR